MNIAQKIFSEHLVEGSLDGGGEIGIRIDHTLTQDATGTMAYLQFESMGIDRVAVERAVSYVDHNTVQVGPENADDHAYLRSVAARYGAVFSRPGNGICHQLHLERFGKPGKTLLGSDSHTPTGGGLGMLAIGAGGIDVAVAMGGGAFFMPVPRVIRINLYNRLPAGVSAKDVVLHVLSILSTKGNVGCILEYGGDALATLDVPERATITNMGAECGVTTSVFPSDLITKRFLASQRREADWVELIADEDAEYERVIDIDLSGLEPLAAAPHSPGNIVTVASCAGKPVQQVLFGSCTNSSYRDLKTVAMILKGRTVHPDVSAGLAPGSRQVLEMLAQEGLLTDLIKAGVRLFESACGFCIGNHASPGEGAVSLRTSNRNFEGRSGTLSAGVYLVSPETAAVAALRGVFTDPREACAGLPAVMPPAAYEIDDSMFIMPPEDGRTVEIVRGPNIGKVPVNPPLPEELKGCCTIKVGDKITTDHIMPAGARLKYRSNVERYAQYVFEGVDSGFAKRASGLRDEGMHNVIIAGESYGQGSSREHAALCPMFLGVKAVVAIGLERIHRANLINFGIVPFLFDCADDYNAIEQGAVLKIEGLRKAIEGDGQASLLVGDERKPVALHVDLSNRERAILLAGGLLNTIAG